MQKPGYFDAIQTLARKRWEQLESDPELAAPWKLLFKQVQSPRHVLSELLQNADDAGATEASVDVEGNEFVFSHNGADFTEEHFASLCRFGFSNKRVLHTIGFRGIGFKSTFSLGDEVRLYSPTLSLRFHQDRFTLPEWMALAKYPAVTEVRVHIKDSHCRVELEKNLSEWVESPISLLFFPNIRSLRINDHKIHWQAFGDGPFPDSTWMQLSSREEAQYLHIRSPEQSFPPECLNEIHRERMLASEEEEETLPPCRIDIVLGLEGRLFVILPTGVKTNLPFAINAPFVQDPARLKIKDPATSPTNRWLLQQAGVLAAEAMAKWIKQPQLSIADRCDAYRLMPDVDRKDSSLEGSCASLCEISFDNSIEHDSFLLSESGSIETWGGCTYVSQELLDIWDLETVSSIFCGNNSIFSRHVDLAARKKLINWGCVKETTKSEIVEILETQSIPQPVSWKKLLHLWSFVCPEVTAPSFRHPHKKVKIVPVEGQNVLFAGESVVRLAEKKLLQSVHDWQFLSDYLYVLNHSWIKFLSEQRNQTNTDVVVRTDDAYKVLTALSLAEADSVSTVLSVVADSFFSQREVQVSDCVRLAQICAALGATITDRFRYVTHDLILRESNPPIVIDRYGDLDDFVEASWYQRHVLHPAYEKEFNSCTQEEWDKWANSEKSRLTGFAPFTPVQQKFFSRDKFTQALRDRGMQDKPNFPFDNARYVIEDWDFEPLLWKHWKMIAKEDDEIWGKIIGRILDQPQGYWVKSITAQASQKSRNGTEKSVTNERLITNWITEFRKLNCLADSRGKCRQPAELLRRTPDTESLLDVEPFVRPEFDTEANRPLLIKLGVRDTPASGVRFLECLRELSKLSTIPAAAAEKWYSRLDQIVFRCPPEEFEKIKESFRNEPLILSEDGSWACSNEIFLSADEEDVPGACIINSAVREFDLWRHIGIAEKPTMSLAINWLQSLPSESPLSPSEIRRIRALLPRYPDRIWTDCQHWLNLEGEWVPVDQLKFKLTMHTLVPWKHLFKPIKQKTADLQRLSIEACELEHFRHLWGLSDCIEYRFNTKNLQLPAPEHKKWIQTLGTLFRRVVMEDNAKTQHLRMNAIRLAQTIWQSVNGLESVPYIDGTPAGAARNIEALWQNTVIYVEDGPLPRMARQVAQEIGRIFDGPEFSDAVKLCFDRSAEFIEEYIQQNFSLVPDEEDTWTNVSHLPPLETKFGSEPNLELEHLPGTESGRNNTPDESNETAEFNEVLDELSNMLNDRTEDETIETQNAAEDSETEASNDKASARRPRQQNSKVQLIDAFAQKSGFTISKLNRLYNAGGYWIQKTEGASISSWEKRSKDGELLHCYWIKEHCLEMAPLQLPAEIWGLCNKFPDTFSLILVDVQGEPIELSGRQLRNLCDSGKLSLFPSEFRIVLNN